MISDGGALAMQVGELGHEVGARQRVGLIWPAKMSSVPRSPPWLTLRMRAAVEGMNLEVSGRFCYTSYLPRSVGHPFLIGGPIASLTHWIFESALHGLILTITETIFVKSRSILMKSLKAIHDLSRNIPEFVKKLMLHSTISAIATINGSRVRRGSRLLSDGSWAASVLNPPYSTAPTAPTASRSLPLHGEQKEEGPPAPARLKDAARRSRGRPGRPVLDPHRRGRPGLGRPGARGAPAFGGGRSGKGRAGRGDRKSVV